MKINEYWMLKQFVKSNRMTRVYWKKNYNSARLYYTIITSQDCKKNFYFHSMNFKYWMREE